jgi:Mrp family chromosome partitioning ATPase/capsular polysaccharide biosynthesis protein
MDSASSQQPNIADYLRPLWSRKWLILLALAIATGGVYAYYSSQPKVYRSATLVYVKDPGDPVTGTPSPQSTDRTVSNQASLLYSRDTAAVVADKIDFAGTPGELLQRVSITSKVGQDFVNVAATGSTPQEAARIANAYAKEFVEYINTSQSDRVKRALTVTQQQFKNTPRGPANSATRSNLQAQVQRLELAASVPPTITRQVDPALPPTRPAEPRPVRNALFAFVLSAILAVAAAFGLERFDRRLKRPDQVEEVYRAPLLATLPHTDTPAPLKHGVAALGAEFQEAFRVLRTNVELARLDAPPRTIVVTSAVPGEGKSTVVRNLALAFRETGKRVAVVEGDLRHPSLSVLLGDHAGPGLTDVLRHDVELDDVTVQIGAAMPGLEDLVQLELEHGSSYGEGTGNGNATKTRTGTITLLRSGPRPANPPAVLGSERLLEVLGEIRARHDIVLIDSAPLLAVTDTVPLLRCADAAVVVCRLGVTSRDTAKRLVEFLERVPGVDLLGVVANDLSNFEASGYGYGGGYGYGYGYGEPSKRARRKAERVAQTV